MRRVTFLTLASFVAVSLVFAVGSSGPASAETLIRTAAASSGVFPVETPRAHPRNASPVQMAEDEGCPCHAGCLRILRTCKAMNEPNCYKDEQRCWIVCNKNHPECRND